MWIFRGYRTAFKNFLSDCKNNYYYEPVHNRYYRNRTEVDIFKVWADIVYTLTSESLSYNPYYQSTPDKTNTNHEHRQRLKDWQERRAEFIVEEPDEKWNLN